jgi:hypothetical protein
MAGKLLKVPGADTEARVSFGVHPKCMMSLHSRRRTIDA